MILQKQEKYKVYEYSKHCEVVPNSGENTHTFFFFAGFNEFASKYIYLYKNFFEQFEDISIKIIIPYLPSYSNTSEQMKNFISNSELVKRFSSINSWFYREKDVNDGNKIVLKSNVEIDLYILNLINKEINKIGSENIILGGFSQGGIYLLRNILDTLKIKSCFNVIFKSPVHFYENKEYQNDKFIAFNHNHIYLYYSRFDKLASFDSAVYSYQKMKNQFNNVFIKFDNSKQHVVNKECLDFLEELVNIYFRNKQITKF